MRKDTTQENWGPGQRGISERDGGRAAGTVPITMKVAFLGSMLAPSALFNPLPACPPTPPIVYRGYIFT
jgi:hypothetical protein